MSRLDQKTREFLEEELRVTSSTGGQKGEKLAAFALIPPEALREVALVYGMGAKKYDKWNWLKGYDWDLSISALHRHINLWEAGEEVDRESGLSHLAHAAFHLFSLAEFERLGLGTDTRQHTRLAPKGAASV